MSADDFNNGQFGQDIRPFNNAENPQRQDQTQGQTQGQSQEQVPGATAELLDADTDTGTEAVTGNAPQSGAEDETTDNAGTDNFASPRDETVEDMDSDTTTEAAGGNIPDKGDIDLDEEDDDDLADDGEDEDGNSI